MNLSTPYRGTFRRVPTAEHPNDVLLEIPILFTRVSTGPSGLVDVVAVELEMDGIRHDLSQDLTLHALSHVPDDDETIGNGSAGSICGDTIRRRPASFKPDADDNNAIVIAFHAMPAANARPIGIREGRVPVVLQLHLLFTNMAPLPIEIRGEIHVANGVVTLAPRPARVTSPVLTNTNMLALALLSGLLLLWHSFFNGDVYEQTPFAQQMVPALLGSLVTFLGLSVGRIKGWLSALVDTLSVFEYPELHFNPALTRRLSSGWFSAGIGVLAVAAATIIGSHWSVEATPNTPRTAVYDTATDEIVTNGRIYRRDLRDDPARFAVVCVDEEGRAADDPVVLAYRRPDGKVPVMVKITEVDLFASENADRTTMELSGEAWLHEEEVAGEIPDLVRRILCQPALSEPLVLPGVDGLVIKPIETGDPLRQEMEVSREWIWEPAEVMENPIADARRKFPNYEFTELFERRDDVLAEIDAGITAFLATRDHEGTPSVVPVSCSIALSTALLDEVGSGKDQKRTSERALLVRSLWRSTADRRERNASNAELQGIASAVGKLLENDLGTKVDRVLLELVLELQSQHEGTDVLHRSTVAAWKGEPSEHRYPRVLDYLVHALALDAVEGPPFEFLREEWPSLQRWAGPNGDLGNRLEIRNVLRDDGIDPTLDFDAIKRRLRHLEVRIQSAGLDERLTAAREPEPEQAS